MNSGNQGFQFGENQFGAGSSGFMPPSGIAQRQNVEESQEDYSDEYYEEPFDSEEASNNEAVQKPQNYAQNYGSELSSLNESEAAELGITSKPQPQVQPKTYNVIKPEPKKQTPVKKVSETKQSTPTSYKNFMVKETKQQQKSAQPRGNAKSAPKSVTASASAQKSSSGGRSTPMMPGMRPASTQARPQTAKPTSSKAKSSANIQSQPRSVKSSVQPKIKSVGGSMNEDIKRAVSQKYDQFIRKQQSNRQDDDDSLLNESQQEATRLEKAQILVEQKQKRRASAAEQRRIKAMEDQVQKDRVSSLNLHLRNQLIQFKSQKANQDASKQKQDRKRKKSIENAVKNVRATRNTDSVERDQEVDPEKEKAKALRKWIDDQMKGIHNTADIDERPTELNLEADSIAGPLSPKDKEGKRSFNPVQKSTSIDEFAKTEIQKQLLNKHKLPGNSMLSDKESSKLGVRNDRYGTRVMHSGPDDFDRVVQIEREKMERMANRTANSVALLSPVEQKNLKHNMTGSLTGLLQRSSGSLGLTGYRK